MARFPVSSGKVSHCALIADDRLVLGPAQSNGGRMDISLQEDVQMATLEELFEFIDGCDCPMRCLKNGEARETEHRSEDMAILDCCEWPERDEADVGACENEAIAMSKHSTTKSSVQASPTCTNRSSFTTQTKPKRRRKRTGWSSSTGLQRRKRAELEFLRKHVKDLEAYAKQLKQRVSLVLVNENACNWQELVFAEYVERLKAEETNRKLKRILESQLHVSATLNLVAEQSAIM